MSVLTAAITPATFGVGDIIKCSVPHTSDVVIKKVKINWYRGIANWTERTDSVNSDHLFLTVDDKGYKIKCVVNVTFAYAVDEENATTETLEVVTSNTCGSGSTAEQLASKTEITNVVISNMNPKEGDVLTATVQPSGAKAVFEWWIANQENFYDPLLATVQRYGNTFTIPNIDKHPLYQRVRIGVTAYGYDDSYGSKNEITGYISYNGRTPFKTGKLERTLSGTHVKYTLSIIDSNGDEVDTEEDADVDIQWERETGAGWEEIPDAADEEYTTTEEDEGKKVRVKASAENSETHAGKIEVETTVGYPDYAPSGYTASLTIEDPVVGNVLSLKLTDAQGNDVPTAQFQTSSNVPTWWRINETGATQLNQGSWSYIVTSDDVGYCIRLQVTTTDSSTLMGYTESFQATSNSKVRATSTDATVTATSLFGDDLKIVVDKTAVGFGETIVAQLLPTGATAQVDWYVDDKKIDFGNLVGNVLSFAPKVAGNYLKAVASGMGPFSLLTAATALIPVIMNKETFATSGEEGGVKAPEKTAHIRGGHGITITPNGECEHGDECRIAKINWDGVQYEQETTSNGTTSSETKWFRKIDFQDPVTGELSEAEDKMTIANKELHFLIKNNDSVAIPRYSFIKINGFETTYASAAEATADLEDREVVLSCSSSGSGIYYAYAQEEVAAGKTGYATFPYAPLVFGIVVTNSGSTTLAIGARLKIETSGTNIQKFVPDTSGLFVVVAFDYESKMVAAFCLSAGHTGSITYVSDFEVSNGVLIANQTTSPVIIPWQ